MATKHLFSDCRRHGQNGTCASAGGKTTTTHPIMGLINGCKIDTRSAKTDWSHLDLIESPRVTIKPTQIDIGRLIVWAIRRQGRRRRRHSFTVRHDIVVGSCPMMIYFDYTFNAHNQRGTEVFGYLREWSAAAGEGH